MLDCVPAPETDAEELCTLTALADTAPAPDTLATAGCTLTPTALTDAEPDMDASAVNILPASAENGAVEKGAMENVILHHL